MSDGNVESLFGGPTGEREVSSACVEGLEYLLERARNGEVIGFAASYLNADGTAYYRFCMIVLWMSGVRLFWCSGKWRIWIDV